MPRTIKFFGSVALLVSSITGPSLVVIPLLFQQAGWLTPLLTFATIAVLSGTAALFIVEIMSSIEGNESFQASVEFTTISHLFLGKRWHVLIQGLLFLAMQVLVIASLLESFQSMDALLISVAHKTCAVSFTDGWVCVIQIQPGANSAFSGYILGSFGTVITLALILPLSVVQLVDNIIFQIVSFIILIIITITWIIIFAINGLDTSRVPVVGRDQSSVAGFILSNFSFVTTVPAWVNNTHPSVNIRRAVWLSIFISCLIYIPVGWMGGSAFALPSSETLLQAFATEMGHGALGMVALVSSYVFPLAVLITSIPVFTIVIRYNLLRGNICSYRAAMFWSAVFPWLVAIPFQTNGGLNIILNWASLIFTSPSNLLIPFILFIISKRHVATAVLDVNVPPEEPITRVSLDGVSLRPASQSFTHRSPIGPVEGIPVLIITESTDVEPGSTEEMKRFLSDETRKGGDVTSIVEAIPMPVMHRVSSPSKHRNYGQDKSGQSSTGGGGQGRRRSQSPTAAAVRATSTSTSMDRPVLYLDTTAPSLARSPPDEGHSHSHHHSPSRRPSLSISLSPSHSITHSSSSGMDEFFLVSGSSPMSRSRSHSVRSVLSSRSGHSPRPSASSSVGDGGASGDGGQTHSPQPSMENSLGLADGPMSAVLHSPSNSQPHPHSPSRTIPDHHAQSQTLSLLTPDDHGGDLQFPPGPGINAGRGESQGPGFDARPADVRITISTPSSSPPSPSPPTPLTFTLPSPNDTNPSTSPLTLSEPSAPWSTLTPTPTPTLVQLPDLDAEQLDPVPTFKAFPRLSSDSTFRTTRISGVAGILASAVVLTAIVYDIVESASGG